MSSSSSSFSNVFRPRRSDLTYAKGIKTKRNRSLFTMSPYLLEPSSPSSPELLETFKFDIVREEEKEGEEREFEDVESSSSLLDIEKIVKKEKSSPPVRDMVKESLVVIDSSQVIQFPKSMSEATPVEVISIVEEATNPKKTPRNRVSTQGEDSIPSSSAPKARIVLGDIFYSPIMKKRVSISKETVYQIKKDASSTNIFIFNNNPASPPLLTSTPIIKTPSSLAHGEDTHLTSENDASQSTPLLEPLQISSTRTSKVIPYTKSLNISYSNECNPLSGSKISSPPKDLANCVSTKVVASQKTPTPNNTSSCEIDNLRRRSILQKIPQVALKSNSGDLLEDESKRNSSRRDGINNEDTIIREMDPPLNRVAMNRKRKVVLEKSVSPTPRLLQVSEWNDENLIKSKKTIKSVDLEFGTKNPGSDISSIKKSNTLNGTLPSIKVSRNGNGTDTSSESSLTSSDSESEPSKVHSPTTNPTPKRIKLIMRKPSADSKSTQVSNTLSKKDSSYCKMSNEEKKSSKEKNEGSVTMVKSTGAESVKGSSHGCSAKVSKVEHNYINDVLKNSRVTIAARKLSEENKSRPRKTNSQLPKDFSSDSSCIEEGSSNEKSKRHGIKSRLKEPSIDYPNRTFEKKAQKATDSSTDSSCEAEQSLKNQTCLNNVRTLIDSIEECNVRGSTDDFTRKDEPPKPKRSRPKRKEASRNTSSSSSSDSSTSSDSDNIGVNSTIKTFKLKKGKISSLLMKSKSLLPSKIKSGINNKPMMKKSDHCLKILTHSQDITSTNEGVSPLKMKPRMSKVSNAEDISGIKKPSSPTYQSVIQGSSSFESISDSGVASNPMRGRKSPSVILVDKQKQDSFSKNKKSYSISSNSDSDDQVGLDETEGDLSPTKNCTRTNSRLSSPPSKKSEYKDKAQLNNEVIDSSSESSLTDSDVLVIEEEAIASKKKIKPNKEPGVLRKHKKEIKSIQDIILKAHASSLQAVASTRKESKEDLSVVDRLVSLRKSKTCRKTFKKSKKAVFIRSTGDNSFLDEDIDHIGMGEEESCNFLPNDPCRPKGNSDDQGTNTNARSFENWELLIQGKSLPGKDFWEDILRDEGCQVKEDNFSYVSLSSNDHTAFKLYSNPKFLPDMVISKRVVEWIVEEHGSMRVSPLNAFCPLHCHLSSDALQLVKNRFPNVRQGRLNNEEMRIVRQNLKRLMKTLDLSGDSGRKLMKELMYGPASKAKSRYYLGCFAGQGILERRFIYDIYKWISSFTIATGDSPSESQIQDLEKRISHSSCIRKAILDSQLHDSITPNGLARLLSKREERSQPHYIWTIHDIFNLLEYMFKKFNIKSAAEAQDINFPYKAMAEELGYKSFTLRSNILYILTVLTNHESGTDWVYSDLTKALEYVMSKPQIYSCIADIKWKDIKARLVPNVPLSELQNIFKRTDCNLPFSERCLLAHRWLRSRKPKERFEKKEIIDYYKNLKRQLQ